MHSMGIIATQLYGQMHGIGETFARIARLDVPLGTPRTLFAAVPEMSAVPIHSAQSIDQAIAAVQALHLPFPGTARSTTAAIIDTGLGFAALPTGIIRTSAGERVFGPIRLETFSHALASPSQRITRAMSNVVALVDELHVAQLV